MKKIYLITGASGFIGSVLCRKLVKTESEMHLILRKKNNWRLTDLQNKVIIHQHDLSDLKTLKQIVQLIKPNIIYHLAAHGAYSYQDNADQIIKTNFLGTWNLLQATHEINYDLFVNTGSSSEYGFAKKAMQETDPLFPNSYYSVAKCAQTFLCKYMADFENKPIVTVRPFSVYGPYEEKTRLIPTLMLALLQKKPMRLVDGGISRDFIYVDDFVDFILDDQKLCQQRGECFNVGTGIQTTIDDLVKTTIRITKTTTDFQRKKMPQRKWDSKTWVADITKAKKILGWKPKYSLTLGIDLTWKWFKMNYKLYE